METPSPSREEADTSILECQICMNPFNGWRRPKMLACRHTCCSVCLSKLRDQGGVDGVRCPWCRCVTTLPTCLSVAKLPDDPDKMATITTSTRAASPVRLEASGWNVGQSPESKTTTPTLHTSMSVYTPVFMRLPSTVCYLLQPPPREAERATVTPGLRSGDRRNAMSRPDLRCVYANQRDASVLDHVFLSERPTVLFLSEHSPPGDSTEGSLLIGQPKGRTRGGGLGMWEGLGEMEEGSGESWAGCKTSVRTRVFLTAFVASFALLFILCIVLQSMSCSSKRFTIISCG